MPTRMFANGRLEVMMDAYDLIIAPLVEFGFMRRALAGSVALALGAAPIGVFLVLRRMSLIGDAMAHAILPGAAIGFLAAGLSLGAMTLGGLVAGLLVVLLAGLVTRRTGLAEDAAVAGFYLVSLALGVTLVSLRGGNVDVLSLLFGSVLALDDSTLWFVVGVSAVTLVSLAVMLRALVAECVDPGFLASVSRAGAPVHLAFLALVVLNLVAGFHALGTLMAVGIMMLPAASARLWTDRLMPMIGVATVFAIVASVSGLIASYHWGSPSGPTIILAAGVVHGLSLIFGRHGGLLQPLIRNRHLEA